MLHCSRVFERERDRVRDPAIYTGVNTNVAPIVDPNLNNATDTGLKLSQQLTISSLFSALALVALALFARAGDMSTTSADGTAMVQASTPGETAA